MPISYLVELQLKLFELSDWIFLFQRAVCLLGLSLILFMAVSDLFLLKFRPVNVQRLYLSYLDLTFVFDDTLHENKFLLGFALVIISIAISHSVCYSTLAKVILDQFLLNFKSKGGLNHLINLSFLLESSFPLDLPNFGAS